MKKFTAAIAICGLLVAANLATAQELLGTYPPAGGPISVTASGGDVVAAGIDFVSPGGKLVPVPGGPAAPAAPFTFFLANTPNQITYGNLGTSVTFANGSTTELSAGYSGGASDVVAAWGNGPVPVSFPVNPIPEPATGLLAAFGGLGLLGFRRRR